MSLVPMAYFDLVRAVKELGWCQNWLPGLDFRTIYRLAWIHYRI